MSNESDRSIHEIFASEFLYGWTTYAIVELEKGDPDETPDAQERRIDRLTRLLFETADGTQKERAVEILSEWLNDDRNAGRPRWPRFKLRHILYLMDLDQKAPAVDELRSLLGKDERYLRSAPLRCLHGNLIGNDPSRHKEAIAEFDAAIRYAPRWSEPKLERIERLILAGDYRPAIEAAATLRQNETRNGRTMILARANLLVARCLANEAYPEKSDYGEEKLSALGIEVDKAHREIWKFKHLMNAIAD